MIVVLGQGQVHQELHKLPEGGCLVVDGVQGLSVAILVNDLPPIPVIPSSNLLPFILVITVQEELVPEVGNKLT